jgi:hypothetical protein
VLLAMMPCAASTKRFSGVYMQHGYNGLDRTIYTDEFPHFISGTFSVKMAFEG